MSVAALALALRASGADAKPRRIGILWGGTAQSSGVVHEAFLAGLKDHGYVVGRDVVVEARYADGEPGRYPALVAELIALNPEVLMGSSTGIAIEMKRRTSAIPIVTGTTSDPVASGLVDSLARPGGNVTGMSVRIHELSGKHIELLAELLPGMKRVAVLTDLSNERSISQRYEALAAAAATARGIAIEVHRVETGEDIRRLFPVLEERRPDALLLNPSPRLHALRAAIIRGTVSQRVASIGFTDSYAEDGGLVSFGPSFVEAIRRTGYFVDRILRGSKPGDLPVEQPTRFSLVVNLKTAEALGIKVPHSILLRADRVIE